MHSSGHLLILGDAAHPFPVRPRPSSLPTYADRPQLGATNGVSMSVCDAGVLGGLFRHLHTGAQVASFVRAFEGLRRERARAMPLLPRACPLRPFGACESCFGRGRPLAPPWAAHAVARCPAFPLVRVATPRRAPARTPPRGGRSRAAKRERGLKCALREERFPDF